MFCKICNVDKSENDFYSTNKSSCKDCLKARASKYRLQNLEKIKAYDRNRPNKDLRYQKAKDYKAKMRLENPDKFDEIFHGLRKRYRTKNKDKTNAESKLDYALSNGKIVRPNKCCVCGIECKPHGHHYDYTKPLDVIWVCVKCHAKIHKKMREENITA